MTPSTLARQRADSLAKRGRQTGEEWASHCAKQFLAFADDLDAGVFGGWEPIESAPRDGTRVIGLTRWGVEPIKWHSGTPGGGLLEGWIGAEQDTTCLPASRTTGRSAQCQPTHWQPLPAPPAKGGERG